MKKLAIIIPYYKIDFFNETIQSVALQTNKNFTLYIGNDASSDDPLTILNTYLKKEEYQYFDYKDNLGGKNLALQWERILDHVDEEWFQILGDDDVISENFVEEFYNILPILEREKISAVKFIHEWIDDKSDHIQTFDYKTDTLNAVEFIIQKYKGTVKSSLSENIFQTRMYQKFRFEKIPLAWGSDDIALLTFSNYGNIWYNRIAKVKVRISDSSISGSTTMDQKKKMATNSFREKMIIRHSKRFPVSFIREMIQEYLDYCHYNNQPANYKVTLYFIKQLDISSFLKTLKKIFYINKIYTKKNKI